MKRYQYQCQISWQAEFLGEGAGGGRSGQIKIKISIKNWLKKYN